MGIEREREGRQATCWQGCLAPLVGIGKCSRAVTELTVEVGIVGGIATGIAVGIAGTLGSLAGWW